MRAARRQVCRGSQRAGLRAVAPRYYAVAAIRKAIDSSKNTASGAEKQVRHAKRHAGMLPVAGSGMKEGRLCIGRYNSNPE